MQISALSDDLTSMRRQLLEATISADEAERAALAAAEAVAEELGLAAGQLQTARQHVSEQISKGGGASVGGARGGGGGGQGSADGGFRQVQLHLDSAGIHLAGEEEKEEAAAAAAAGGGGGGGGRRGLQRGVSSFVVLGGTKASAAVEKFRKQLRGVHEQLSLLTARQHRQSGRLGEAIAGLHGLIRLHLKAWGGPPHP